MACPFEQQPQLGFLLIFPSASARAKDAFERDALCQVGLKFANVNALQMHVFPPGGVVEFRINESIVSP